jgi:hypothetical protein
MAPILGVMILGGAVGYLLLVVPLAFLQTALQARLALSLSTPKKGIRGVLDRIDFAPAESWAKRVSDRALRVYLWTAGLGMLWMFGWAVLSGKPLVFDYVGTVMAVLVGALPVLFLQSGTNMRLVFVATVQNRLIASTKGRAALLAG